MRRQHLIVTGASGYIGQALIEAAVEAGLSVTVLGRQARQPRPGVRHLTWRLGEPLPAEAADPALSADAQALLHLAHDWSATAPNEDPNLTAARVLLDGARTQGIGRVVFVSSLSARPDALNRYGRAKWAIEQVFDGPKTVSLRVGLVYGGPRVALYGLLCRIVGLSPLLPMIEPRQPVQPIHRLEVVGGILAAAQGEQTGALGLAAADPLPFGRFLDTLALRTRAGRVAVLPLPLRPVLLACRLLNGLPLPIKVDPERVLGLAGVRFVETRADLARLGLTVAAFADGMAAEPVSRRCLLAEGRCLLRYILRSEPGGALVRRYARAVLRDGPAGALAMSPVVRHWPSLMRWLEPVGGDSALRRRLRLATALAEASPEGERALARGGRAVRVTRVAGDMILDGLALPVRLALGQFAR